VSFISPIFLLSLLAVPLVLGAYMLARKRRRRYAVRFPGVATLAGVVPRSWEWRRRAPLALFLTALAALGIALARPEATVSVPREQATIVLVTDVSRSMLADDVAPTRLDAARSAAQRFLDELPKGIRVGAVAFAEAPHTIAPPTEDRDEIRALIDSLAADGGTATGDGLQAAVDLVDGKGEPKTPSAIVLLSDGKATTGRDPIGVAREAKRLGIPVNTVALGSPGATITTPDGSVLPVPPDPETMREIARVSGGRSFAVSNSDELSGVYQDLGSRVASKKEKREITAGFAAAGILLLLGAAGLGLRTTARLP
jgi:Ca-activated chloride channel family protein